MEPWSGRRSGVGVAPDRSATAGGDDDLASRADKDGTSLATGPPDREYCMTSPTGQRQGRSVKGEDAERSQRVSFGRPGSFPPKSSARPARA